MSTVTDQPTVTPNVNELPPEDIKVEGGAQSWRFAKGKIVRGKEITKTVEVEGQTVEIETGTYPEEKTTVVGVLRRVGIYQGISDKYGETHKLEADIETRSGMVHIGCNLLDQNGDLKVGISALNFAWCLLQFAKDGPMRIETVQGQPIKLPNGKDGGRPTYVNAYEIVGDSAKAIYRPKHDPGQPKLSMNEQWELLEAELRTHPAYKEREFQSGDAEAAATDTHLGQLCAEVAVLGWPTPEQAPAEWLAMCAAAFKEKTPKTSLSGYDDHTWGKIRQSMTKLKAMPAALEPARARLAGGEEVDPFENQ